jgi:hypothetical protein
MRAVEDSGNDGGESSPSNVPDSPQEGSTADSSGVLLRLAEQAAKNPPVRSTRRHSLIETSGSS